MSKSTDISVLVVEDEDMIQEILCGFTQRLEGFDVVQVAGSCRLAQVVLEKEAVDLVLLDVYLPDGLGLDLLRWIRASNLDVDVILITADRRSETFEMVNRFGAIDYLIKPFRYERFCLAMEKYRSKKNKMEEAGFLDQSLIDQKLSDGQEVDGQVANVGNGFQNPTYDRIYGFLFNNSHMSYTSTEVANQLGISRITARRYLEMMEQAGEVVMSLDYGYVGRPRINIQL